MANEMTKGEAACVSLKEYIESRILSLDKKVDQMDADHSKALIKAETALDKRLDLLNEFRAQSAEESKRYVTLNVYNEKHAALSDRVDAVERQMSRMYGGVIAVGAIGIANLVKLWFAR